MHRHSYVGGRLAKNPLTMKSWSSYVVGIGVGMLSWFAFAVADQVREHPAGRLKSNGGSGEDARGMGDQDLGTMPRMDLRLQTVVCRGVYGGIL